MLHLNCFVLLLFCLTICYISDARVTWPKLNIFEEKDSGNFGIIGGEAVDIKEVPYQVSLHVGDRFQCGGSIIAPNIILTAAHCIKEHTSNKLQIRAGSSFNNTGGVVIKVSRMAVHEKFTFETVNYDVGLVWLSEELKYGETVQPIKLAESGDELKEGTEMLASGWGRIWEGGPPPKDSLQKVIVPVINKETCNMSYPNMITRNMLCAGYPEGKKSVCHGDSGGPLVNSKVQYGIVSWGMGCARPKKPGVYTKVAALRQWIDEKIKSSYV